MVASWIQLVSSRSRCSRISRRRTWTIWPELRPSSSSRRALRSPRRESSATRCLQIETGTADVLRDGQVVGTVGPGDVVGEIAVIAAGRRTATVVATSPMRLIAVFKRDVWALERSAPQVAERLRALLALHRDGS